VFLLLTLVSATSGGVYTAPPGDTDPTWSPDTEQIAFRTNRDGGGVKAVAAIGGAEAWIVHGQVSAYAIAPDWSTIAYVIGDELVVSQLDGSERRVVAVVTNRTGIPAWAPDSRRLAFTGSDGWLYVVDVNDEEPMSRLALGFDPAWSPDGSRIAYAAGAIGSFPASGVHVMNDDGTSDRNLAPGDPRPMSDPAWSSDGDRVAFLTQWKGNYVVVAELSAGPQPTIYHLQGSGPFAWTPDARAIVYTKVQGDKSGLAELNLATRRERMLLAPTLEGRYADDIEPTFAPDGIRLAFSGGRECRDRRGISVVSTDDRSRAIRVSNDCRVVGTAKDDTLRGTRLADVLVGLSGDDRLLALDALYVGDSLRGGPGDDILVGASRSDVLEGGPGQDRLYGGPSGDTLVGGPGRDRLSGSGGKDLIRAADGFRDVISCGADAPPALGLEDPHDEVFADAFDRLSSDCEVVHLVGYP
jgi:Tol biopolymer transport system component